MDEEVNKPTQSRLGRTYRLARLATDTSAHPAMGLAKRVVGSPEGGTPADIEQHRTAKRGVELRDVGLEARPRVAVGDDRSPRHADGGDGCPDRDAGGPIVAGSISHARSR